MIVPYTGCLLCAHTALIFTHFVQGWVGNLLKFNYSEEFAPILIIRRIHSNDADQYLPNVDPFHELPIFTSGRLKTCTKLLLNWSLMFLGDQQPSAWLTKMPDTMEINLTYQTYHPLVWHQRNHLLLQPEPI